jgi:flagellar basal body-associated protein FliL
MVKLKTKVNVKDLKEYKGLIIFMIILTLGFLLAMILLYNFSMNAQPETQSEAPIVPMEELNQQPKIKINDTNITQEQPQESPYESLIKLMISSFPIWFGIFLIWKVFDWKW